MKNWFLKFEFPRATQCSGRLLWTGLVGYVLGQGIDNRGSDEE